MIRTHNWTAEQYDFLRANADLSEADLALAFRARYLTIVPLSDRAIARRRYTILRADRARHSWTDAQVAFVADRRRSRNVVAAFRREFPSASRFLSDAAIRAKRAAVAA